jgi:hypothetical protein
MTSFNLEPLVARDRRRRRLQVIFCGMCMAVVLTVLFSIGFMLFVTRISTPSVAVASAGAWMVLLVVLAVGFSTLIRVARPRPETIEVDPSGVKLTYPKGRVRSLTWSDWEYRARIEQVDVPSPREGLFPGPRVRLYGKPPERFWITREAQAEIIASAQSAGLRIDRTPWKSSSRRRDQPIGEIIRIHG